MTRTHAVFTVALSLLLGAGCDDPPTGKQLPTFEDDAGAEAGAGERTGPQFVVLSSDWTATSVSLLDKDGKVLADDYLNSGSVPAGLVTALSGDVEMPTQSNDPGVLVLIDRYRADVITRVRLSDGTVLGQVKTHTPPTQATENAYTSNPQDYLRIDDQTAWVVRSQPNLDPGVPAIDRGNDLLRIDPSTMTRTEERIDLSVLNGKATRQNLDTGKDEEVDVYAKPSRMARVGDTLVVGLAMASFDFTATGAGSVGLVDLTTRSARALAIPGLTSCDFVAPVPGERERVLVGCRGTVGDLRATAGVAIVLVQDGEASVERSWRAAEHPEAPVVSGSFVALSGTRVAGSANSYDGSEPSSFGIVDLESGAYSTLLSAVASDGTFGLPVYDAASGLLLVPDGSVDADKRPLSGVRILQPEGQSFRERETVKVAAGTTLPVRHVFAL